MPHPLFFPSPFSQSHRLLCSIQPGAALPPSLCFCYHYIGTNDYDHNLTGAFSGHIYQDPRKKKFLKTTHSHHTFQSNRMGNSNQKRKKNYLPPQKDKISGQIWQSFKPRWLDMSIEEKEISNSQDTMCWPVTLLKQVLSIPILLKHKKNALK